MAIDSIFLDSGVLRAYIDRRDEDHDKCFATIHDYNDLHSSFYTTTLNIAELSFWLDKSRSRYGKRMRGLENLTQTIDLEVCDVEKKSADLVFREWLRFCKKFKLCLDFTDYYLYQAALKKSSDYIMTTDKKDFTKILALGPSHSKWFGDRKLFTHDEIIFI